jgi:hypothetical protein
MSTFYTLYGTYVAMAVTALQSLASSATACWQSARVNLQGMTPPPTDVEIFLELPTANTAPGNDQQVTVYVSPAITTDGGTTWKHTDQGTTTPPSGTEGTTTIAEPCNLKYLGTMTYKTQNMTMRNWFLLSDAVGMSMPDGFSLVVKNFTGAALAASGCIVAYKPINTAA